MSHYYNINDLRLIQDLIDHPIISYPYAPKVLRAHDFVTTGGSWVFGKGLYMRVYTLDYIGWETLDLPPRRPSKGNSITNLRH